MFEHKTIQWIVAILSIALFIYMITLLFDDDGRSIFHIEPKQEFVYTSIDSAVPVYQVGTVNMQKIPVDTFQVVDMATVVAVVDSDSIVRYDLYRHQQEKVTIDLNEHKEKVFFTWEDIQTYFHAVTEFFTELINKIK